MAMAGLAASGTHLGQPRRAWKIFLGWRRSWLSREAMVFGAFALLGLGWMSYWAWSGEAGPWWAHAKVTLIGLLGVASSIMVYHDTGRVLWRAGQVVPRFAGTTLLLGSAAAVSALVWLDAAPPPTVWYGVFATAWLAAAAKLGWDLRFLARRWSHRRFEHRQSVRLLRGPLWNAVRFRFAFGLAGLFLLTLLWWPGDMAGWKPGVSWAACLSLIAAELGERYLFFTAVALPRMPGGLP
jgi:DMSO reductase anchor subunit